MAQLVRKSSPPLAASPSVGSTTSWRRDGGPGRQRGDVGGQRGDLLLGELDRLLRAPAGRARPAASGRCRPGSRPRRRRRRPGGRDRRSCRGRPGVEAVAGGAVRQEELLALLDGLRRQRLVGWRRAWLAGRSAAYAPPVSDEAEQRARTTIAAGCRRRAAVRSRVRSCRRGCRVGGSVRRSGLRVT